MKTTIKINLKYAQRAYEAITDNRYLEENVNCEYPDVWVIDEDNEGLVDAFINQLDSFGIPVDEIEILTT